MCVHVYVCVYAYNLYIIIVMYMHVVSVVIQKYIHLKVNYNTAAQTTV